MFLNFVTVLNEFMFNNLRSITVLDTIFDVLCILLLAGCGISIFDMRRRTPLFPKGVSCRPIPRPMLGAPGLSWLIANDLSVQFEFRNVKFTVNTP